MPIQFLIPAAILGFAFTLQAAPELQSYQAATLVLGQPDFTTATRNKGFGNRFDQPTGVAIDPLTGKLFVSDSANNRILRFSNPNALANGNRPEIVIGQINFSGAAANGGGGATRGTLNGPYGITVDFKGRLWVADILNHRVLGFFVASSIDNDAKADVVLGQPNFTTATPGTTAAKMFNPAGISVGADDTLWVSEFGGHRVLRFQNLTGKPSGSPADGVLGQADFTSATSGRSATKMKSPLALYADSDGRVWVADSQNNRVLRFDNAVSKANGAAADAVIGQPDFNTGAIARTANSFQPHGVYLDNGGALWITDYLYKRVLRFSSATSLPVAGAADLVLGKPDFTSESTATPSSQELAGPQQITGNSEGDLFVADFSASRVLEFESTPILAPVPAPAPPASIRVRGKKKVFTSADRIRLRGRADNAAAVEFKAGRGRFKPTRGNLRRWKAVVKLDSRRTAFKVRAINADGIKTKVEKVIILQR